VSADIVVADAVSPQAWNAFSYVGNSPMVFVNPTRSRISDESLEGLD